MLRLHAFAAALLVASCTRGGRSAANGTGTIAPLAAPDSITGLALDSALARCPGANQPLVLIVARGGLNTQGLSRIGMEACIVIGSPCDEKEYGGWLP